MTVIALVVAASRCWDEEPPSDGCKRFL